MKILIIGCGSIGERHLNNLISMGHEAVACDLHESTMKKIEQKYRSRSYTDYKEAIKKEKIEAVLICTPHSTHITIAEFAAKNNCHIFIEKPISDNLEGIDTLEELINTGDLVLLVGCNMRFHKPIRIIKEQIDNGKLGRLLSVRAYYGHYLPNWRPMKDYRETYSSESGQGGILLDGIHEIDYITWLAGGISDLFCLSKKISELEINSEDIAEIILEFENGALGQIHLDYLRHQKFRSLEIIGEKATVLWYSEGKNPEMAKLAKYSNSGTETLFEGELDFNEMFIKEMAHFIDCIENKAVPENSIKDAKSTLELTLKAKKQIIKGFNKK
ncbi:Gfo/Idh/MocA family protein [Elusimicrobiota bacterium]